MNERPSTMRRQGAKTKRRPLAEPRLYLQSTLPTGFVKSRSASSPTSNYQSSYRLPVGFMTAINDAFVRRGRISDRVRRIHSVLHTFAQSENALPTKIRLFLKRFDEAV